MEEQLRYFNRQHNWAEAGVQEAEKRIASIIETMYNETQKDDFTSVEHNLVMVQQQIQALNKNMCEAGIWEKAIAAFDAE
jgi:predicted  nucleic acid-binding Zn-ribbon protein